MSNRTISPRRCALSARSVTMDGVQRAPRRDNRQTGCPPDSAVPRRIFLAMARLHALADPRCAHSIAACYLVAPSGGKSGGARPQDASRRSRNKKGTGAHLPPRDKGGRGGKRRGKTNGYRRPSANRPPSIPPWQGGRIVRVPPVRATISRCTPPPAVVGAIGGLLGHRP